MLKKVNGLEPTILKIALLAFELKTLLYCGTYIQHTANEPQLSLSIWENLGYLDA
jgi:hypothetical protein